MPTNKFIFLLGFVSVIGCKEIKPLEIENNQKACSEQIEYRSDTDPAYRYLESKQNQIYQAFPNVQDPFSRKELTTPGAVKSFEDLIDRLDGLGVVEKEFGEKFMSRFKCEPLNTRHQSPMTQIAIQYTLDDLVKKNPEIQDSISSIRFGALPTGKINGTAILPPNSDNPLIIIERDIYNFTGAFSKSISDAIPITSTDQFVQLAHDSDSIEKRIIDNPEILANFIDATLRMIKSGTARGAKERKLEALHYNLHGRLVSGMDSFIINHEVAHILLDHVKTGEKNLIPASDYLRVQASESPLLKQLEVKSIKWENNQELEADRRAVELMLITSDDDPVGDLVSVAAAEVIFELFDLIETYKYQAGLGRPKFGNHPSASVRKAAVNDKVNELRVRNETFNANADFRELFNASLDTLIRLADPIIREELKLAPNGSFPKKYQIRIR